mgnify:CR=1 FL=1
MVDDGSNNGAISLKFPGVTRNQIIEIRENYNPATPETKRKLKADPLKFLYDKGKIDSGDLRSSELIKAAYLIITAEVTGRNSSFETFIDKTRKSCGMDESEFQIMVQEQYYDWHDELKKKRIFAAPIIYVLTEPVSFRDADAWFGQGSRTASRLMVAGLKLYSSMF